MKIKSTTYPQTIDKLMELFEDAYKYLLLVERGQGLEGKAQALKNKLFRSHLIPFINSEGRKCVRNLINYKTYDLETLQEVEKYFAAKN